MLAVQDLQQLPRTTHVDAIRTQLSRPGRRADDVALLAFALHKEFDDLGDAAAAWQALELGCRAKRSTLHYSASETASLVDALIAAPTMPSTQRHSDGPTPIFIVGMISHHPVDVATDGGFNSQQPFAAAATTSLYGLGPRATLILVDGRRVANYGLASADLGGLTDLNGIPLTMVDRIEVMRGGASAIYGADAMRLTV